MQSSAPEKNKKIGSSFSGVTVSQKREEKKSFRYTTKTCVLTPAVDLGPKLRFSVFPKSWKPLIPKSISINGNLALIRALYVSGGPMVKILILYCFYMILYGCHMILYCFYMILHGFHMIYNVFV